MSSLVMSVLIVAVIGLAAIVAYNLLRRQGRMLPGAEKAARASDPDLLRATGGDGDARTEPRLGRGPGGAEGPGADPGATAAAVAVTGSGEAAASCAPGGSGSMIAESTDCIVELPLEEDTPGERLLALTQGLRRVGAKPVIVEGLAAAGDTALWGPLQHGTLYRTLRVGILLANRHGPLNAMEFSEFVGAIQERAEQLSALADTPEMSEVLARARELDMLCAQLDAQIGINVEASAPIAGDTLAGLARGLGLHDRGGGRYARSTAGGEVMFTLSSSDSGRALSLLLDVPRVAAAEQPLGQMFACARQLAERLDAVVVDDGGRALSEEAIAAIGRQLDVRYASLEAAGFPAGSALALRLFN